MKLNHKTFKTIAVKGGKQYVEVKARLQYLSSDFEGEYSINTDYRYFEARKMWVVKATLTLEQSGVKSTYTGLAQEVESTKFNEVNFTSALENAETSAVGRACAMAGIGIDIGIASADEMNKAGNRPRPAEEMENGTGAADVTPPKAAPAPVLVSDPVTDLQKDEIRRLLAHETVTQREREKMLKYIDTLDFERAADSIAKLMKAIAERTHAAAVEFDTLHPVGTPNPHRTAQQ